MPHSEGYLHILQLRVLEDPDLSADGILSKEAYHLFRKTSVTVLAMFNKMQAPSINCFLNPFCTGRISLRESCPSRSFLLFSMSSSRFLGIFIALRDTGEEFAESRRAGEAIALVSDLRKEGGYGWKGVIS